MKKSITFKISDLDLLKIKKEASESGMMISEYVRKVIESSIALLIAKLIPTFSFLNSFSSFIVLPLVLLCAF